MTKEKERRVCKHVGGVFWVEKSASVETRCGYEFGVLETVWLRRSEQGEWWRRGNRLFGDQIRKNQEGHSEDF